MKRLGLALVKRLKRVVPPEMYLRAFYEYYTGHPLDLDDPRDFGAKIQWLKLHYRDPRLPLLVDKYAVRDYVEEKVGGAYLNELLGVWERSRDVAFDTLPERFVVKATHGYGFNIIVEDRRELVPWRARLRLARWLRMNQYWRGSLEWAYRQVPPRIVAETYLEEPGRSTLSDYKFYCFDGEPHLVQVHVERGARHRSCFYDTGWTRQPVRVSSAPPCEDALPRPARFDEMLEVARALADDFPFVRVDLYNLDGRIVFGEMTFYPNEGRRRFRPESWNRTLGGRLRLPTGE